MRDVAPPPGWLQSLVSRRLPTDVAEAILGDLLQEHAERVRHGHPRWWANVWFAGQWLGLRKRALRRAAARLDARRPGDARSVSATGSSIDLTSWLFDVRYAVRRITRAPGFSLIAVLSLALGIGVNTAMFSVINGVLFRPLPLESPHELVEVYTSDEDRAFYATSSIPDLESLRERNTVFSSVVGTRTFVARLDHEGEASVVFGELVSWNYFQTLGVGMTLGRTFLAEEDRTPGTHPVAILGHRTWEQEFGADPTVLGRSAILNNRAYTIVGVAPADFPGSMPSLVTSVYLPMAMTDVMMGGEQLASRGSRSTFLKARLLPGATLERATAELDAIAAALAADYPDTNRNRDFSAVPSTEVALHPAVDRVLTPIAVLLLAVVGLVLTIACANLASFLLARAEARRREIAVRLALGARRRTLIRQLLIETTLLSAVGGAAALLLAGWTVRAALSFQPPLPVPIDFDFPLDRNVLFFTVGVSLLAGLAFGLLPALQATRPDIAPTLKNDHVTSGRKGFGLRGGLVAGQVALSFVLLIGAGLFLRSLEKAQTIDPGFDTGPAAILWPMPEMSGIEDPDEQAVFLEDLRRRLLAEPTITAVGVADRLPLGIAVQTRGYVIPEVPSETPDGDHDIDNARVDPGYYEALGVPILQGRAFEPSDVDGPGSVVVSEAFVNRFYPGESAIGRTLMAGGQEFTVVGVAADTKVRSLGEAPRPYVYEVQGRSAVFGFQVVVRGSESAEELVRTARGVLEEVLPGVVYFEEPKTMEEHLALLLFPPRMAAGLLSLFGSLALMLSAIGVYGVVSYSVSARTREVGIRMSLGASARDVVGMVVRGGMRLVVFGAVIGVALAGAASWAISGFLFGIGPGDVVTFLTVPGVLLGVALLAAWVPARRATAVDPVRALRTE